METNTMGRVIVPARIENLGDYLGVIQGTMKPENARSVEVLDALIDTGATNLSLPSRFIRSLGLVPLRDRPARTSAGPVIAKIYCAVRLKVQERECTCDVMEVPDDCPVLIGQVPLELLDFVVDPGNRRLIGNPDHGGEQMYDLY
jgi:predicted aspartyl protease